MYSKKFNPTKYEPIKELLEQIQDLEEGSSLLVSPNSEKEEREMRWLLYDWFFHMGLKHLYRLRRETGGLGFRIFRSGFRFTFSLEEGPLPRLLALYFKELLSLSREEVEENLEKAEDLEEREKEQLLRRWSRVMED